MKSQQMTTSAALYFLGEKNDPIPLCWLDVVRALFGEFQLAPILFSADGGDFLVDDCYVLADQGNNRVEFGEELLARSGELTNALRRGEINSLGLDSPHAGADHRGDWQANVDVSPFEGLFYVGIDKDLVSNPSHLLQRALQMATGLLDIHYGIAYQSQLAQCPDGYASGFVKTSVSEVVEWMRHRTEWDYRTKTVDELWTDELIGKRRHLCGLFRGAYPASILSELHLQKANLLSHRVGKLSKLNESLWLWELSDEEIPVAQGVLESEGVLVSQTSHE